MRRFEARLGKTELRIGLPQSLGPGAGSGARLIDLIDGDKLAAEKRLEAVQIVICVLEFDGCLLHRGFGVIDIGARLIDGGSCFDDGGVGGASGRIGSRRRADLRTDLPLLIRDLSFERGLLGFGILERIQVRRIVDIEQQLSLFDELIVVDRQFRNRPVHYRCDADEVSEDFGVVGTRLQTDFPHDQQSGDEGSQGREPRDHAKAASVL